MSIDWERTTVATYDAAAPRLAEYFAGIGARTDDIERAVMLAGHNDDLRVVEIGCGDGRDAQEIIPRVTWYEGIDPSAGMLDIARQKVAEGQFVKADAESYDYPKDVDVIFAFASLLHVSRERLDAVMQKFYESLKPMGIAYLSLKHRAEYAAEPQTDTYGTRMFHYYSRDDILQASGARFEPVYVDYQTIGKTDWMTIALRKQPN